MSDEISEGKSGRREHGGGDEEVDSKAVAEIVEVKDGVEAEDDPFADLRKDSGKRNTAVFKRNTRISSRIKERRYMNK